jgi:hypothetical protein
MKTKMTIKNQKGAAIVEFAIVAPLLVLLVIGICEFGLLWYNSQVIINGSREGARVGIVQWEYPPPPPGGTPYTDNEVRTLKINPTVQNYCSARLVTFGTNNPPTVVSTWANRSFQEDVSVQVTYNYSFLVPSLFHLGMTKQLKAETVMKMEAVS